MTKPEKIRDPIHDLIEFGVDEFERQCWAIVQTRPFQRLRRIKQLGFSEFVYPGATHSRLSHSLGVFNTARQLAAVVRQRRGTAYDAQAANLAVAAALVHDVGHGPFSHAFEGALKALHIGSRHEEWTERIILETEVRDAFDGFVPMFSEKVATIFERETPTDIYSSIVSSQFDADRLDYMRRDRLMTGTQQGAIDFRWLLANLEVDRVKVGQDGEFVHEEETFVLGPKAIMAAEEYVLSLFQLYPTVYFHKATRGAEKIFTQLLMEVFTAIRSGSVVATRLPRRHPLVRFILAPDELDTYLELDDSVVWGCLPLLSQSSIPVIARLSERLLKRRFYKSISVTGRIAARVKEMYPRERDENRRREAGRTFEAKVRKLVSERRLLARRGGEPRLLADLAERNPYKIAKGVDGALNQIWVAGEKGLQDLGKLSPVVGALVPFRSYRLYYRDDSAKGIVEGLLDEVLK